MAQRTTAARLPGPAGAPSRAGRTRSSTSRPTTGAALVGGEWRYADARVEEIDFVELGSAGGPARAGRRPEPHLRRRPARRGAGLRRLRLARARARRRRCCGSANGRVCFNWYRITVTIPERIGDLDPTGATVVFEIVVDDYAEIWVNGELPLALGDTGGRGRRRLQRTEPRRPHARRAAGRRVLDRRLRDQRADLGVAAQLHLDAHGHARRLRPGSRRRRAGRRRSSSTARRRSSRRRDARAGRRRLRVHRGPGVDARRRAAVQLAEHERDLPLDARRAR